MARDKKAARGRDEPQVQEEMTVIVMRFTGSSQSLQKGFDAVSQALSALGPGSSVVVQRQPPQLQPGDGVAIDAEAQHPAEESTDGDGTEAGSGSGKVKLRKPRPRQSTRLWVTLTCRRMAYHR